MRAVPLLVLAATACKTDEPNEKVPLDTSVEVEPEIVCESKPAAARLVRRLSMSEYVATIEDLVGITPTIEFVSDGAVNGFDNNAETLTVSTVLADQLRQAAEDIATAAVAESWSKIVPCSEETRACAELFIADFGKHAFRRPLSETERNAYLAFYDESALEDPFEESIRWLVAAFLQSPYFLYRTEIGSRTDGDTFALSDWEIASELSYLFWGTMPDDRLFDLAEAGELHTSEQIRNEVDRLVLHPKAAETVSHFMRLWLPTERVRDVVRSEELYPDFTPEIREMMIGEFDHLVEDAYWNGQSIQDLLVVDHTFMTEELATFYGIPLGSEPMDAEGFRKVDLGGEAVGGILTQGALMASLGTPTTSSPIHRGKFVRENILCQEMPPPPNDVVLDVPEYQEGVTTRSMYENYTLANEYCAGCHDMMDRIGFGFENFDGSGRWRDEDAGNPVDATGEILRSPHSDGTFAGPDDLALLLADSTDMEKCYVRYWLEFASGVEGAVDDECVDEVVVAAREQGGGLAETLITLSGTEDFRFREGLAYELDGPAPAAGE